MSNGEPNLYEDKFPKPAFRLDEPAFEIFFKQQFASCCAFCQARFGFDTAVAKDVVHTAFIKLWETRHTISIEASIKSYLFRIVVNASLDFIRHEKTKQKYSRFFVENNAEAYDETDTNTTDFKQLAQDIQAAISELPDQMRTVFELSRYEELKYSAIAERLGISVKTVETQMSRALVKLRQKLGHYLLLLCLFLLPIKFF